MHDPLLDANEKTPEPPEFDFEENYLVELRRAADRLEAMREDNGGTWDLSENDREAIGIVLQALRNFARCNEVAF